MSRQCVPEREREWWVCVRVCMHVCVGCVLNNYSNFVQCSGRQVRFPQLIDIILNSFTLINDIIPSDRSSGPQQGRVRSSEARWVAEEKEREGERERREMGDGRRGRGREGANWKLADERGTRTLRLIWRNFPQPPSSSTPSCPFICLSASSSSSSFSRLQRSVKFHYKLMYCSFLFEHTLLIRQLSSILLSR